MENFASEAMECIVDTHYKDGIEGIELIRDIFTYLASTTTDEVLVNAIEKWLKDNDYHHETEYTKIDE